jgi:Vps54-like protein
MHSAGLKNTTAKHLALASQSLSIVIALILYIHETFRCHHPYKFILGVDTAVATPVSPLPVPSSPKPLNHTTMVTRGSCNSCSFPSRNFCHHLASPMQQAERSQITISIWSLLIRVAAYGYRSTSILRKPAKAVTSAALTSLAVAPKKLKTTSGQFANVSCHRASMVAFTVPL